MMQSARWRGMALPILCLAITACGKPDSKAADPKAVDPNAPAVVKAPPIVLPSDTAKKPDPTAVTMENAKVTMARDFGVLAAAISFGDKQMIAAQYAPDATLVTPNGSFQGKEAIVAQFAGMKGLKVFQRLSRKTSIVDSTVLDSGVYEIVLKRAGADSLYEQGVYASVWRVHPEPMEWVMSSDHLYPSKKKGK